MSYRLSQALEQASLTFAGELYSTEPKCTDLAYNNVASSASIHVMPPVVLAPAPTPQSETQTSQQDI